MTERWLVPWWWWIAGLLLSLGAAAEIHGGADGAQAVLPYVAAPPRDADRPGLVLPAPGPGRRTACCTSPARGPR